MIRAFEKEDEMLNRVLPGIGKNLGPRCHLSKKNEYMVLEDLSKDGYGPCRTMDLSHAECAVRELARLHGASLVIPEKELKEKYSGVTFESLFLKTPGGMPGLLESYVEGVRRICEEFFEELDRDLVVKFMEFVSDTIAEFVKPSGEYRNVILHGDPWGNNFLYRYDKSTKMPVGARLVDFQASRFAPPALDLVEFLYLSTSPEFRKLHKDHLLSYYYLSLSQFLSERGISVSSLLPRDSFLDSCLHYERLGITVNVYYAYLTRLPAAYLAPLATSPVSFLGIMVAGDATYPLKAFKNNYAYRTQFTESLMDALKLYKELHVQ